MSLHTEEQMPSGSTVVPSQITSISLEDLPPALSPLSAGYPDGINMVLGEAPETTRFNSLIREMTRQDTREADALHTTDNYNTTQSAVDRPPESSFISTASCTQPQVSKPRPPLTSPTLILNSLGSQPKFSGLQQALNTELQNSPNSVPHSLIQANSTLTSQQKIPITSRAGMLQVSFMQLQPIFKSSLTTLKEYYDMQSASMETSRFTQLCLAEHTPWLKPSINYYFDLQHHALIDNLEYRIECLKSGAIFNTSGVSTTFLTHSPAHTISPITACHTPSPHILPRLSDHTSPYMTTALPVLTHPISQSSFIANGPQTEITGVGANLNSATTRASMNKPLNPLAVRVMQNWYDRNSEHPYPSHDTCLVIAKTGNITPEQVKKWFANKRMRNGRTKSIKEIARRRKLPLDAIITLQPNKCKTE